MEFCQRLKSLRLQAGITQRQLSEMTGVSGTTVGNWETGVKQPSMNALIALCDALHVSADVLIGTKPGLCASQLPENREEAALLSDFRGLDACGRSVVRAVCELENRRCAESSHTVAKFPVRTEAGAGTVVRYIPKFANPSAAGSSAPLDGEDFELIPVSDPVPKDAEYAVRISGDSMFPYICDGDTVYVKKTDELRNGDAGIFCVNGAIYCKLFFRDDDGITLVSLNPALKQTNIRLRSGGDDTFSCLGKVLRDDPAPRPSYRF